MLHLSISLEVLGLKNIEDPCSSRSGLLCIYMCNESVWCLQMIQYVQQKLVIQFIYSCM